MVYTFLHHLTLVHDHRICPVYMLFWLGRWSDYKVIYTSILTTRLQPPQLEPSDCPLRLWTWPSHRYLNYMGWHLCSRMPVPLPSVYTEEDTVSLQTIRLGSEVQKTTKMILDISYVPEETWIMDILPHDTFATQMLCHSGRYAAAVLMPHGHYAAWTLCCTDLMLQRTLCHMDL